ncbi:MAG: hypothetical protein H6722_20890 [Sandaracinus sp.]|nr:hypothetical protein [Sandaracinus sp.]
MAQTPSRKPEVGGSSPAARVIREALGSVATPTVAARVLHRALHLASEAEIPRGGEHLRRFVQKHLRSATAFVLGDEVAHEVVGQLAPLLQSLPSLRPVQPARGRALRELEAVGLVDPAANLGAPGSLELELELELEPLEPQPELEGEPHPLATRRTDRAPHLPLVLVASLDDELSVAVKDTLSRDASVVRVDDVVMLLDAVQSHGDEGFLCVLLDGHHPSVHPATLATIADDLPEDTLFVSWGVATHERRDSLQLSGRPQRWLDIPTELDVVGAADELKRLLGLPLSGVFVARRSDSPRR